MQRNRESTVNYKRVTNEQKQELLRLVELHKYVLFGQLGNSGSERQTQKWEFVAREINKIRGPNRSAQEWRKVYANMKALTKKKTATLRTQRAETGGGQIDPDCMLTEEDEIIQRIAGPSCDGIPQQEEPGSIDSFDPNRAILIFPRVGSHENVSPLPCSPPEEHLIATDHEDTLISNQNEAESINQIRVASHHQMEDTSQSTIQQEILPPNNLVDYIESTGSNVLREEEGQIAQEEAPIANQDRARGAPEVGLNGNNSQPNSIPLPAAGRRRTRYSQTTGRGGNNLTMSNVQRALDLCERHIIAFERFVSQQEQHNIATQRTFESILEILRNSRN